MESCWGPDQLLGLLLQYLVCKRKLESKKEALLILSKELDTCQQERDQYKLMANQLRERHQSLKKKYRELIVRMTSPWHSCSLVKIERGHFNMPFPQKRIEFKQFQSGKIKRWMSSPLNPPQPSPSGRLTQAPMKHTRTHTRILLCLCASLLNHLFLWSIYKSALSNTETTCGYLNSILN